MGFKPCSVPDCKAREGIRFRFPHPTNAQQRFAKWLEIVKNPQLDSLSPLAVYNLKRLCAKHFAPECLIKPNKLKYSAIPTLFVPDPDAAKNWNYAESTDYFQTMRSKLCENTELNDESKQCITCVQTELCPALASRNKIDMRCRVCLTVTENGLPLNYITNINGEESLTLSEIINKFCNVQAFLNDIRPQSICISCAEEARAVYEFSTRCKRTDSILQAEMGSSTIKAQREFKRINNTSKHLPNILKKSPLKNKEQLGTNTKQISSEKVFNKKTARKIAEHLPRKSTKTRGTNTIARKVEHNLKLLNTCKRCSFHEQKLKRKLAEEGVESERKKTVVCLRCYKNFKKQYEFYLYGGVFIRKKGHRCVRCGARFANSVKLNFHLLSHKNENGKTPRLKK